MTRQDVLDALTAERFGTGGVLRSERLPEAREATEREMWLRLKQLADATKREGRAA